MYTIIRSDSKAVFVQGAYDTEEEAQARLDLLRAKFGDRYNLTIAQVDDQPALEIPATSDDVASEPVITPTPTIKKPNGSHKKNRPS
jgi:hypothetical protein